MKYLIIGSGRMAIGGVYDLINLNSTEAVQVIDRDEDALEQMKTKFSDSRLKTSRIDADDTERIIPFMKKADAALSAIPYDYNLKLTELAIQCGCHFVDLGGNIHVVQKQFNLDRKAKQAGVGIVPDCGLAPGMASIVSAHAISKLDKVDTLEIRVGGLPVEPKTPLNYRLIFSVHGLINQYIEPCIILENGKITSIAPMTEIETITFPEPLGQLEAFHTSGGISTLPMTYENEIKNLNYKTIRYPGHCERFKMLIDMGFTDEKAMKINGKTLPRRETFERLLEEILSIDGEDMMLMRVSAKGLKDSIERGLSYEAIEYGDAENGITAMMRTTSFPAIIILEMLADGRIHDRGVLRQELSIPPDLFLEELAVRNIKFKIYEI